MKIKLQGFGYKLRLHIILPVAYATIMLAWLFIKQNNL